jgi:hypothetical protein
LEQLLEFVGMNLELLNWEEFSKITTWEIVSSNPDQPWNWSELSESEYTLANPDKPWNYLFILNFSIHVN